jgi:hypothetical protein
MEDDKKYKPLRQYDDEWCLYWPLHEDPGDVREPRQNVTVDERKYREAEQNLGTFQLDSVNAAVVNRVVERAQRGMRTYGVSMSDANKTLTEWLSDAQEELLDACVYLEKVKQEVKKIANDLRKLEAQNEHLEAENKYLRHIDNRR